MTDETEIIIIFLVHFFCYYKKNLIFVLFLCNKCNRILILFFDNYVLIFCFNPQLIFYFESS